MNDTLITEFTKRIYNLPLEITHKIFNYLYIKEDIEKAITNYPTLEKQITQAITKIHFNKGNPILNDCFENFSGYPEYILFKTLNKYPNLKDVSIVISDITSQDNTITFLLNPILHNIHIILDDPKGRHAELIEAFLEGLKLRVKMWGSDFTLSLFIKTIEYNLFYNLFYDRGVTNIFSESEWDNYRNISYIKQIGSITRPIRNQLISYVKHINLNIHTIVDTQYDSIYYHELEITKIGFKGSYINNICQIQDTYYGINKYLTHVFIYTNLASLEDSLPFTWEFDNSDEGFILSNLVVFEIPIDVEAYSDVVTIMPNVKKLYTDFYYNCKLNHLMYLETMDEMKSAKKKSNKLAQYDYYTY